MDSGSFQKLFLGKMGKALGNINELQQELDNTRFEATAGGGAVTAVASGMRELLEVRIDPEVVNKDEIELLQDLIVAAVRGALDKAGEAYQAKLSESVGLPPGMKLPGMF